MNLQETENKGIISTDNKPMSKKMLILLVILFICLLPIALTVIIAKSPKLKKSVKAALIAVVWLFFLIIGATNSDDQSQTVTNDITESISIESTTDHFQWDETTQLASAFVTDTEPATEEPTTEELFTNFEAGSVTLEVGETKEYSATIMRKDLTAEDIIFENTSEDVIAIDTVTVINNEDHSILTFACTALTSGSSNLRLYLPSDDIYSDYLFITATITPTITSISSFPIFTQRIETSESNTHTVEMTPADLTTDDFKFIVSDTSVISVFDVQVTNEAEKTFVTFSVYGAGAGTATLKIQSTDGLTESNVLDYDVEEKDTSPTVYTTPTGEKYHYSKACAGKNAIEKTLNMATEQGYDPCKKCA